MYLALILVQLEKHIKLMENLELLSLSFLCTGNPRPTTIQLVIILSYDGTQRMVVTTGCQSSSCPNTLNSHGIIISNLPCLFLTKSVEKLTGKGCKFLGQVSPTHAPSPILLHSCNVLAICAPPCTFTPFCTSLHLP